MQRPYRVVLAEVGDDPRGLGVRPLARALRDGGFEVVSLGPVAEADRVVSAAVQEDADAVGLGLFVGAPAGHAAAVLAGLADRDLGGVRVFTVEDGPDVVGAAPPRFAADGPAGLTVEWLTVALDA